MPGTDWTLLIEPTQPTREPRSHSTSTPPRYGGLVDIAASPWIPTLTFTSNSILIPPWPPSPRPANLDSTHISRPFPWKSPLCHVSKAHDCLHSLQTRSLNMADTQPETGLPPNWEVRHSNSKNLPYYFNSNDRNSRWEPPPGTDTEKLKVYMAKFHSPNAGSGAANNGGGGADSGKIRAAHLLVKHNQSRRPMSWKEVRGVGERLCCPSSVAIIDAPTGTEEDRTRRTQCCWLDPWGLYPPTRIS
ncbi:hypothetical protein FJTKL_12727 [Diaporthe vaccinii]|uniref:peptidylprolyl isomerase n=1 Tax=Diaporthe vaccinii TaxID=105482 RepID=A0ABR4ECI3_9PEZI